MTEARQRLAFLSDRFLHLVLMPTEQCNFRCTYCWEDFALGSMPPGVEQAVRALIERRLPRLEVLSIDWFGGEPLLAWPLVERLQSFIHSSAVQKSNLRFSASMSTNASRLDRGRFERLLGLGVRRFQVTLDGDREAHDSTRRRLGGGGSFDAIWRNLVAMREVAEDFEVTLRLHLMQDNGGSHRKLLELLAAEFAGDRRFPLLYKAVHGHDRTVDASHILGRAEAASRVHRFFDEAEALGLETIRNPLQKPGSLPGCPAAAVGSYVIRSNGDLMKCPVALRHENNKIGKLLPDGRVQLDDSKMRGWIRGALTGDRESLECPAKGFAPSEPQLVEIGQPV